MTHQTALTAIAKISSITEPVHILLMLYAINDALLGRFYEEAEAFANPS